MESTPGAVLGRRGSKHSEAVSVAEGAMETPLLERGAAAKEDGVPASSTRATKHAALGPSPH